MLVQLHFPQAKPTKANSSLLASLLGLERSGAFLCFDTAYLLLVRSSDRAAALQTSAGDNASRLFGLSPPALLK
jgi:hypothetical protein